MSGRAVRAPRAKTVHDYIWIRTYDAALLTAATVRTDELAAYVDWSRTTAGSQEGSRLRRVVGECSLAPPATPAIATAIVILAIVNDALTPGDITTAAEQDKLSRILWTGAVNRAVASTEVNRWRFDWKGSYRLRQDDTVCLMVQSTQAERFALFANVLLDAA